MEATLEARVLSRIQTGFPLVSRPYATLGDELGASEDDVLAATGNLRASGIIRRIGATFDPLHLGYVSTLAAAEVVPERIEEVADFVDAYPEVTHDYQRDNRYNLWFTVIAVSRERVAEVLAEAGECDGVIDILDLPATRLFKIRVDFDVTGTTDILARHGDEYVQHTVTPREVSVPDFPEADRALVRMLQGDIGIGTAPFADIAGSLQTTEGAVLSRITRWREEGVVRRFGAVVRHQRMGVTSNAMAVWDVPDSQIVKAGELMSNFVAVSHCYERPRCKDWPTNVYTMIHAGTDEECVQVAHGIRAALVEAGIVVPEPQLLFSSREFKKHSMLYFMEDAAEGDMRKIKVM